MARRRTVTGETYRYGSNKNIRAAIRTVKKEIKLLDSLLKTTTALQYVSAGSTISTVTIGLVVFSSALAQMLPAIIKKYNRDLKKLQRRLK